MILLNSILKNKKITGTVAVTIAAILTGVLQTEGGYVNDPKDPGGETNKGITIDVARSYGYLGSMKNLPEDLTLSIYLDDYVIKPKFDEVIKLSPAVGEKLIDAGVNTGISRSSLWFQKSLNAVSRGCTDYPCISEDGRIGAHTLNTYKLLQEKRGNVLACSLVLKMVDGQQTNHYMSLTKLNSFTIGWITHRIGNVSYNRCDDE